MKDNSNKISNSILAQNLLEKSTDNDLEDIKKGDFVICLIEQAAGTTLFCKPIVKSSITEFA